MLTAPLHANLDLVLTVPLTRTPGLSAECPLHEDLGLGLTAPLTQTPGLSADCPPLTRKPGLTRNDLDLVLTAPLHENLDLVLTAPLTTPAPALSAD